MTPQEQTMLGDLIRRVQTTNLTEKDPDAQNLLEQQLGSNVDALYVLAQTVLVQNYALEQAKRQMDELKQQAQATQPAKASSFLGSIFGHTEAPKPTAMQQPAYAQAPPATQWSTPQGGQSYPPQGSPAQNYPAQNYPQQGNPSQAYPPQASGGGSSFLRSAATTAAGVAAGALAFEGVESLMHGFGHQAGFGGGGFGGGGFGGGVGGPMEEETVVNNYYDSPGGEGREERGDRYDNASDSSSRDMPALNDASYTGPQSDLEPQLDQADDVNVSDDDNSYDDASTDDSSSDDSGGDDSSFV